MRKSAPKSACPPAGSDRRAAARQPTPLTLAGSAISAAAMAGGLLPWRGSGNSATPCAGAGRPRLARRLRGAASFPPQLPTRRVIETRRARRRTHVGHPNNQWMASNNGAPFPSAGSPTRTTANSLRAARKFGQRASFYSTETRLEVAPTLAAPGEARKYPSQHIGKR